MVYAFSWLAEKSSKNHAATKIKIRFPTRDKLPVIISTNHKAANKVTSTVNRFGRDLIVLRMTLIFVSTLNIAPATSLYSDFPHIMLVTFINHRDNSVKTLFNKTFNIPLKHWYKTKATRLIRTDGALQKAI